MSFVIYALLTDTAPAMSPEGIRTMLHDTFGQDSAFTSRFEEKPFTKARSVRAEWDGWSISFTYGEGVRVKEDSEEIKRRLADAAPAAIEAIDRRIHVFFADDPDRQHTTQIVDVMQFLEEISGVILYDPQQNNLVKVRSSS